ncbi:MAG: MazG nucleotide pyrophosphohydrolase domain-containing protein, partial [Thermodesulfobacteriota bacterium]
DIPRSMPSLLRAQRIGDKASQAGFDWEDIQGVVDKVKEELSELEHELKNKNKDKSAKELGDLFFSLVNLSRHMGIDAETVSQSAVNKFIQRFNLLEDKVSEQNKKFSDMSPKEMNEIWNDIKKSKQDL